MEKISAACALSWSIELEKGLRSMKPGRPIESICNIGARLNQWSMEPELTQSVCNMFGLVPGEDRAFADAILFRLADAFVSGDKAIRMSITKVFLSIFKHNKGKEPHACRIFSNMSTSNSLELLRRVGPVLHAGCVKSRALAFILFGCWADIAKDVSEIRYAILSSLTSCHGFEVKASLFAAGCFSERSNDFGYVFLERLLTLMTSDKTEPALRVAGAHSFANIRCTLSLAIKSYKAGAELVQKIVEEDVMAAMLVSLTKISLKAVVLVSEQVGLLCLFLSETTSSNVQATILLCIHLIGERSACFLPISAILFQSLFRMLDEPNTPSALRCDILNILCKVIAYRLPDLLPKHSNKFEKLLRHVENSTRSPFLSERLVAFENLLFISTKLKGRTDTSEVYSVNFPSRVVATVIDQITVLVSRLSGDSSSSEVGKELGRMLHMLLGLVEDHSELGYFILDKLHLVVETFVNLHNLPPDEVHNFVVHKVVNAGTNVVICPMRVLMLHIYKFLVQFLEVLHEAGATTKEAVLKLKLLISYVCDSCVFDCSIHALYATIWYSHFNRNCLSSEVQLSDKPVESLSRSPCQLLEHENVIRTCVNNMLAGGDNWCAYRAGRYAACEGLWDVADFIFQHLLTRVQSNSCCQWLKFLIQFSNSEKNIQLLLQQKPFSPTSGHVLESSGLGNNDRISSGYIEQLANACNDISCSDKVLEANYAQKHSFYFQRWFLALRQNVILAFVDYSKIAILGNRHSGEGDVTGGNPLLPRLKDMLSSLNYLSSRMASLAEEIDLVTSSFIDMDSRSSKIMSDLALSCSLLALCTTLSNPIAFQNLTKASGDSYNSIVRNLVGCLWPMDSETCFNLLSLLKENGVHERSFHLMPRLHLPKSDRIAEFYAVCRCYIKRMTDLHDQSLGGENEDALLQKLYSDGVLSLYNVVEEWMHIPLLIPKYLFRVRCSMGSVLFCSSANASKQKEILVSPGCHLALNLCIQLKDMPAEICSRFSKIHCILHCHPSFSVARFKEQPTVEPQISYQASEMETMIHFNKKLQGYVMKRTAEFMYSGNDCSAGKVAEAYVCFETNGKAQGFSTCLLDVSTFPVGSYKINWHSGGVDRHGAYWSILPLSPGPQFTVE